MSLASDLRVAYRLLFSPIKGSSHRERLDSFYRQQADDYDHFRDRLLHGRRELYQSLPIPAGGHWIEMGGGTGRNLEYLQQRIDQLDRVSLVDLSNSLLGQAKQRLVKNGWRNVQTIEADATKVDLPLADVVTFSYSLTMIPDWFAAIDHAIRLLKPNGLLAVVDFYVARKYPEAGFHQHGWLKRNFWPVWFASDNVFLSQDHLPYLANNLETVGKSECLGKIPYLPGLRVPYYTFIGRKLVR